MKTSNLLLLITLALPVAAGADDCPALIEKVDEILAAPASTDGKTVVEEEARQTATKLRARGKAQHEAGLDASA